MEVRESPDGVTIVNDAYNANPESMRAALKTLVAMAAGRRTWAVLGEMRELGDESMVEHDAIGRLAVRLDISRLLCVGAGTRVMHLAASNEGSWGEESAFAPDVESAWRAAVDSAGEADRIVAFGSFLTVAAALAADR